MIFRIHVQEQRVNKTNCEHLIPDFDWSKLNFLLTTSPNVVTVTQKKLMSTICFYLHTGKVEYIYGYDIYIYIISYIWHIYMYIYAYIYVYIKIIYIYIIYIYTYIYILYILHILHNKNEIKY